MSPTDARRTTPLDVNDPAQMQEPWEEYDRLRAGCPAWSDEYGGHWLVGSYEHVWQADQDWQSFCSGEGLGIPPVLGAPKFPPIELDPPLHLEYRRLLNPWFSPPAVAKLESEIRRETNLLIDAFIETGRCDLVVDLALPMPAVVMFSTLLGLPLEGVERCQQWTKEVSVKRAKEPEKAAAAHAAREAYLRTVVEERRASGERRSDIIDTLMHAVIDGEPMTTELVTATLSTLVTGGLTTTTSGIGTSLHYLAEHTHERDRLIENPDLLPIAIEELLRYQSPIQGLGRTMTTDLELGGQQLRKGEKVMLLWGCANRDPGEFSDADRVVIDRFPNRHLAFGVGVHRCLGAHLARLEIRVVLESVLARLPDYRLDPGLEVKWQTGTVRHIDRLPVTFTPGPRVES